MWQVFPVIFFFLHWPHKGQKLLISGFYFVHRANSMHWHIKMTQIFLMFSFIVHFPWYRYCAQHIHTIMLLFSIKLQILRWFRKSHMLHSQYKFSGLFSTCVPIISLFSVTSLHSHFNNLFNVSLSLSIRYLSQALSFS